MATFLLEFMRQCDCESVTLITRDQKAVELATSNFLYSESGASKVSQQISNSNAPCMVSNCDKL